MLSLLNVLRVLPNINLVVIDPMKLLTLNTNEYPNYYQDNDLTNTLDKLNEYISNLIETKSTLEGYIVIYGFSKFVIKINDNSKITELMKKLKTYEKISIIVVDDAAKIKNYGYESWFTDTFSINDGIWIGRGITEQNLLRVSSITKEMMKELKNDMGYILQDNMATLAKFIDFVSNDDEGGDADGE